MAKTPKAPVANSAAPKTPVAPKAAAPKQAAAPRTLEDIMKEFHKNGSDNLTENELSQVHNHYMTTDPRWFAAQVAKGNTRLFPNGCTQEQIDFNPGKPAQAQAQGKAPATKRGPAPTTEAPMTAQQAEEHKAPKAPANAPKPAQGKPAQAPAKPPRAAAKGNAPTPTKTALPEQVEAQAANALPESVIKVIRAALAEAEFKGAPLEEVNDLRSQVGLPLLSTLEYENAALKRELQAAQAREEERKRTEAAQAHEAQVETRPVPAAPKGEAVIKHVSQTSAQAQSVSEEAMANGKPVIKRNRGKQWATVDMSKVIAKLSKDYLGLESFEAKGNDGDDWTEQHVTQLGKFAQDVYLAGYAAKEAELEAAQGSQAPQAPQVEEQAPQGRKRGPAPDSQASQAPRQAKPRTGNGTGNGNTAVAAFRELLLRDEGCTRRECIARAAEVTGKVWPSISVQQQAEALGLNCYVWKPSSGHGRIETDENGRSRTVTVYTASVPEAGQQPVVEVYE